MSPSLTVVAAMSPTLLYANHKEIRESEESTKALQSKI